MDKNKFYEPPINWTDYEDIALALYEKFGDDFDEFEDGYGTDDYDRLDFDENWN